MGLNMGSNAALHVRHGAKNGASRSSLVAVAAHHRCTLFTVPPGLPIHQHPHSIAAQPANDGGTAAVSWHDREMTSGTASGV